MSPPDSRTGPVAARHGRTGRAASEATAQARTPRSGGRTAAQRPEGRFAAQRPGRPDRPRRGGTASAYPTQGSAALAPPPVITPAAGPRARLQVAPPVPVAVPRAPFVVLILMVVVGGVLGVLLLNTEINENAFRLHDLRARQVVLDQRQQHLEQQIAEAESPGSLAAAARRLGLVPAGEPAFLRLPDGTVVGVPVPAAGTPSRTSQQAGD
jgi:hypothetical protein